MAGWTDEMVEGLKRMWDEGLTTGEIGKRLGVSKNSIVGKVHRLKLVSRPSPIKKKEDPEAPAKEKEAKKVEEKKEPAAAPKPIEKPAAPKAVEPKIEAKKEPVVIIKDEPITCAAPKRTDGKVGVTDLDNHTCRWPLGDPKDENFHFCGKKVRVGQTYCEEHSAIAYVKASKK